MAIQTIQASDSWFMQGQKGVLPLNIGDFAEADGTALAAFGASSPTPGYSLLDSEALGIRWHNHATPDPIGITVPVPYDLDSSKDVVLKILASKTGASAGDAVTWLVTAFFLVEDALHDADADAGGTSSAMTAAAAAKTLQLETLTIAAADVQSSAAALTLTIQPADGTLGTDDVAIFGVWLEYTKASPIWKTNTYCCRLMVPYVHKLSTAKLYSQNIVTTGTVQVQLRQTDPGDGRGGALVGDVLENDDLDDVSSVNTKYDFTLYAADKRLAPALRQYFLVITGTDPADRVDEPTLVLEVDDKV
jgi:hypothetical protein